MRAGQNSRDEVIEKLWVVVERIRLKPEAEALDASETDPLTFVDGWQLACERIEDALDALKFSPPRSDKRDAVVEAAQALCDRLTPATLGRDYPIEAQYLARLYDALAALGDRT